MNLIMVAGLPSSGTSMVAGVLHHLGVDMGDIPTLAEEQQRPGRPYRGYECREARAMIGDLPSGVAPAVLFDAMRTYAALRLARAPGPCGFKLNAAVLVGQCNGLESLPLTIVQVKRDLETTFASDIRHTGEDYGRAMARGALHLALRQLVRRVPPACVIQYEQALRWPFDTVQSLADGLDLQTTAEQRWKAAAGIDRRKCRWDT